MSAAHIALLRGLLSRPVAPFREAAVVECIRAWAARSGVAFRRDDAGNVLLRYRRGRPRRPRWVLTAHMDHPGFVAARQRGRSVWAQFRGGVGAEYFVGSRVLVFAPAGEVRAVVRSIRPEEATGWQLCRLELAGPADVPPGTIGMWDVPAWRLRGRVVSARSCDDVAGTAAVCCAIGELARRGAEADVTGLLTRAEEVGFVGALAACRLGDIPRGAYVVGIESSKAQPQAPLGGGAVIRVGDRIRTFDPQLTEHLAAVGAGLARRGRPFRYSRALMPGGTCESTVYCLYGHRAAAAALPLANYHNMDGRGRIRPEKIHLDDFASLVALLAALPAGAARPGDSDARLRARLDKLLSRRQAFLAE